MTPKLPPLPEPDDLGDNYYGTPIKGFTAEAMNARYLKGYNDAIAAIEAQGVPDGWNLIETAPKDKTVLLYGAKRLEMCVGMNHSRDGWVTDTTSEWASMYPPTHWMPLPDIPGASASPAPQTEQMVRQLVRDIVRNNSAEDLITAGEQASVVQGVPDVVQEWKSGVISAQEAMLKIASSPPAPQASVLNQSDMPEDMAKVLRENAWDLYATGEQTSVVQQEPVAWKHDCAVLLTNDVELWIDACPHCGKPRIQPAQQDPVAWLHPANATCVTTDPTAYARGIPLYTHPAPQAKPLSDSWSFTDRTQE